MAILYFCLELRAAESRSDLHLVKCSKAISEMRKISDADFGFSKQWKNPLIFRRRIQAVLTHQNAKRRCYEFPPVAGKGRCSVYEGHTTFFVFDDNYQNEQATPNFVFRGDSLFRGEYNDIFGLNYVYFFEGERLIQIQGLAEWYLKKLRGPWVSVHREMSQAEYKLWITKKYDGLGRSWSFGARDLGDLGPRVIHFSSVQYNENLMKGNRRIKVLISRNELLKLSRLHRLWSGVLDWSTMKMELILTAENFHQMIQQGKAQIDNQ